MTPHQDIVQGGGGVAAFGWLVTAWAWVTGTMPPLAVIATLMTIGLTALKLWDAIKRVRKGKPLDSAVAPLGDR